MPKRDGHKLKLGAMRNKWKAADPGSVELTLLCAASLPLQGRVEARAYTLNSASVNLG